MYNRLLIIDSEKFDREIARKIFSGKYKLDFVASVLDVNYKFMVSEPDVVLYEMRVPNIDDLADVIINTQSKNPPVPLVLIISENSIEIETFARIYKVFYCLIRPFNLKELWNVLESAFIYRKRLKLEHNIDNDKNKLSNPVLKYNVKPGLLPEEKSIYM